MDKICTAHPPGRFWCQQCRRGEPRPIGHTARSLEWPGRVADRSRQRAQREDYCMACRRGTCHPAELGNDIMRCCRRACHHADGVQMQYMQATMRRAATHLRLPTTKPAGAGFADGFHVRRVHKLHLRVHMSRERRWRVGRV